MSKTLAAAPNRGDDEAERQGAGNFQRVRKRLEAFKHWAVVEAAVWPGEIADEVTPQSAA